MAAASRIALAAASRFFKMAFVSVTVTVEVVPYCVTVPVVVAIVVVVSKTVLRISALAMHNLLGLTYDPGVTVAT